MKITDLPVQMTGPCCNRLWHWAIGLQPFQKSHDLIRKQGLHLQWLNPHQLLP